MDGTSDTSDQLARFVARLGHYRDRLLHADWRNRSVFLRRPDKKYVMDLGALWKGDARKLDEALKKAVWTRSSIALLKDSERGEEADQVRSNAVALERTSRTILEETGLSDTYLGFPFLVGHSCKEGYVRAPLLLFPARLERVRGGGAPGWYLAFGEDEGPVLNRALLAAMRKVCGISSPDDLQDRVEDLLEEAPREALSDFLMQRLHALLASYLKLEAANAVDRVPSINALSSEDVASMPEVGLRLMPFAVVGSFPQGSTAIFRDYEEMMALAEKGETDLGIIDDLLEARLLRASPPPADARVDIDSTPDREINNVLPSDSSQDAVLLEAQRAEAVVVRGPPGTGKSQVITNLITNAMAKGERVLVVCQKRAALDVVHQRLGRAGLSEAAVLLHDARADRSALYSSLARRMSGEPPGADEQSDRQLQEASSQIDALVAELNAMVRPLGREMPNGAVPRDLYIRARPGYAPMMDLGSLPARMSERQLGALMQRLPDLQVGHWRYDRPQHPWHGRSSFAPLTINDRFAIDAALSQAHSAITPNALTLGGLKEQGAALSSAQDYLSLEPKALRKLNPRWRSASKAVAGLLASLPSDPRAASAQDLVASLQAGREMLTALEGLARWLRPEGAAELRALATQPEALHRQLDSMSSSLGEFDALQEHDRAVASLDPVEREAFLICAARLPPDGEPWAKVLEQEIVLRWIMDFESRDARLSGEPFARYLELRKRLGSLMDQRRELLRRRLAWKALDDCRRPRLPPGDHHPNRRADTDWNRLISELGKKRRVKPVRKLLEDFEFQLLTVAPIWLVSPEAASEVFPLRRGLFHLVIFDESSQLAVERALPALYRGRRALIAGDEKQLRPFDLFQTREEEERLDEVTEAESLLVLGMRVLTPRYLSWHYRSKYQELIDFSNHAFYDGHLEIAANVQRRFETAPIDFVQVQGTWEDRANSAEAEKVVDIVHWLLSEGELGGRMPSLGVITFNEQQRDLVEELVERRRSSDPEFERLFGLASSPQRSLDDRPFVKNIENVQGDERDVIIFSVAYAPDRSGKLRVQFGPLNMEGGENRLNVAVTRAKERVVMVTSFDPAQLPVDEVKNLGPRRLKDYLLYAKAVSGMRREEVSAMLKGLGPGSSLPSPAGPSARGPSLEVQVKAALEAQGFAVEERVGFSGYRVDLAVVDPGDQARFVLGIEGDGPTFQSARSARERDVLRQRYLEDRGWAVDRAWSRNWWRDQAGETKRLTNRILSLSEDRKKARKAKPEAARPAPRPSGPRPAEERRDAAPASPPRELPYDVPSSPKEDQAMRLVFFQQLESWSQADAAAAAAILDWCEEERLGIWWHEYRGLATFTPYALGQGRAHYFLSLRADGAMDLHFQHMGPPFHQASMRRELLRRLNAIPRLSIPEDYADKWRTVMLERVRGDEALEILLGAMRWWLQEIRRAEA